MAQSGYHHEGRGRSRRALAVGLALLLALQGCRSASEQADRYEALYDRLMPLKAYPPALQAIRTAVRKDENEPRRWLKLGNILLAMDRPSEAVDAFQHALDLQPDNVEAMANLSILSVRANELDLAKRYSEPLLLIQPNNLGGLIAQGAIALRERRYQDVIKTGDIITADYPDRADGPVVKARALDGLHRTREAVALLESHARSHPGDATLLQQLLDFYQKLGDRTGIQNTAIRLMQVFPGDPRYALESLRAFHARGREDLSQKTAQLIQRKFGDNPQTMVALCNYWRQTLPPAAAHAQVVRLAEGAPPQVKASLAGVLTDMGDAAGAVALLAPLAPAEVANANVDYQGRYARALLAAGRTADAQAKVDALLRYDPSNPEGLLLRARLALARGDFLNALTDAQLVARDDDSNEEAALLIARIYAAQRNPFMTSAAFGSARNRFPNSAAVIREETNWLLSQKRAGDAVDRAASFAHTHPRRGDGWAILANTCKAAGQPKCLAEAQAALKPAA